MRKIVVLSFITLDGVVQAPGGSEEDPSDGFSYGGWTAPYYEEVSGRELEKQLAPSEYLLGRKTYEIFAGYWPEHGDFWPSINSGAKYVMSTTLTKSDWNNTTFISTVDELRKLKESDGPDLQVHGSGKLVQTLLQNDLVDELWLKFFPITLGTGKKLFDGGAIPAAFELTYSTVTPAGVIFANYTRAGSVETGEVAD